MHAGNAATEHYRDVVGTPEELTRAYPDAFNKGDLDAVVSLYERGASLVPQPGAVVTGTEAIREAIRGFLALTPTLRVEAPTVVQAGELALFSYEWSLTGTGPDGASVEMRGRASDIVRRQLDGSWLIVVDNPFARGPEPSIGRMERHMPT